LEGGDSTKASGTASGGRKGLKKDEEV